MPWWCVTWWCEVEEAVLSAATVPSGLCEEVLKTWDARPDVARQRDLRGSDGVGASQVMAVGPLESKVVDKPRLPLANLAAKGNHSENDELVARGGVPPVVVARLFLGTVKLLD